MATAALVIDLIAVMLNVDSISIRQPVQMKSKGSPYAGRGLKAMLLAAAAHRQAGTPAMDCVVQSCDLY